MGAPTEASVGLKPVIVGGGAAVTVNVTPLLATPETVTTTFPVVAPLGTGTTIVVAFQLVGAPTIPLNVTVLVPCVVPKFVPVIVTELPAVPVVGLRLVMLGVGSSVNATPLLATPETVTTTLPVVAPLGTGTTMLVALQLVGVPTVPLKVIVLVPCVVPKLVPVTVTEAPTAPDVGLRLVMLGVGPPPLPALNVANAAPHGSDAPRDALPAALPAEVCIWSSAISFVFGSAGTVSSIVYPPPVVKFAGSAVEIALSNRSPFAIVVAFPLFGDVLFPCADVVTSSEFAVATPEYSAMANRRVSEIVSDMEIVFVPPATFSA